MQESKYSKLITVALFICVLLFGVTLIIWPDLANTIVCRIIGCILCIYGLVSAVMYFVKKNNDFLKGNLLTKGLIAVAAGVVVILKTNLFSSLMAIALGVLLVAGGIYKIQLSIDMLRMKFKYWFVFLILAVINCALGCLAVIDPSWMSMIIMRFVGICIVIESIADMVSILMYDSIKKKFIPAVTE